ncbi:hypothetical protein SUGI_0675410 [Cryptomeria japonica]|nr:hypothetical protein SUGI_0675410 [Cryptomeria japonica]
MVTSLSGLVSILSMPLGPREVQRILATALAAAMLAFYASSPFTRVFFSCSLNIINGLPNSSNANAISENTNT